MLIGLHVFGTDFFCPPRTSRASTMMEYHRNAVTFYFNSSASVLTSFYALLVSTMMFTCRQAFVAERILLFVTINMLKRSSSPICNCIVNTKITILSIFGLTPSPEPYTPCLAFHEHDFWLCNGKNVFNVAQDWFMFLLYLLVITRRMCFLRIVLLCRQMCVISGEKM